MKDFYRNLWLKGMGRLEVLRVAQLAMLRKNRMENDGNGLAGDLGGRLCCRGSRGSRPSLPHLVFSTFVPYSSVRDRSLAGWTLIPMGLLATNFLDIGKAIERWEPRKGPNEAHYSLLLENKGIGISHERLLRNEPLEDEEILAYLVHSRVTEQRAHEEIQQQREVFAT